ncbi:MAG: TonB-dependent receptor, partial [Chitinophagaceae bacterium]
ASVSLLIGKDSTLVKTTVTDKNGEYKFNANQNGSYLIMATSVGYKKAYSTVLSINEQNSTIDVATIVLSKESRAIKEVAITAQKPFIERRADKLIVNVESSASAAGNTALEVLQKSPGIAVDKDDNISMNGKNSVLIMIDGKPTYMSSADVANMLRSIQSSEIETIELITNPSAKYDAAGNAGIINIKTKRNKSLGFNGTLSAGTGYGETSKYNSGLSMNFRKGKMNVFGNYNYSNNGNISRFWLNRVVAESADLTRFAQSNSWDGRRSNNSYKIGADWFVNKKTTFGILMNGYNNGVTETALSGTEITNTTFSPIGSLMVDGNNKQRYVNTAFNFNAKSTL